MNKKTKQNSFRPTLENLETREMMSVSPLPITQNKPTPITPNKAVVMAGYNDAGDIKEAIAKDKDNTMDEAINLGNLLEGQVVKKQGVISFGAMPKTPNQPSWGQYCGLNSRDVDLYKFTVKAGDRVTFKFNTTVESTIWKEYVNGKLINVEKKYSLGLRAHLSDSTGNALQLIADDGGFPSKLHGDVKETSVLEHTFNKAGTYYLGISNSSHENYNIINGQEGSRNNLNSAIGPYSLSVSVKKDLPEFEAVNLRFNDSRTSLIFDYKMDQKDYYRERPKDWKHNIGLYWTDTNGKVFGEIKNQSIDGFNKSTNFGGISQIKTFNISLKDLGNPPNDLATHIRFVVNSGNKIPELNVSNNFKELKLFGTFFTELEIKKMIIRHEGSYAFPYKDGKGLWTIGVGHLIGDGKSLPKVFDAYRNNGVVGDPNNNTTPAWTVPQIEKEFNLDYIKHKNVAMKTPGWELANDRGQAAMIDLSFNMGAWYKKEKEVDGKVVRGKLEWKDTVAALVRGDFEAAANGLTNSAWYNQVGDRAPEIVGMIRSGKKY